MTVFVSFSLLVVHTWAPPPFPTPAVSQAITTTITFSLSPLCLPLIGHTYSLSLPCLCMPSNPAKMFDMILWVCAWLIVFFLLQRRHYMVRERRGGKNMYAAHEITALLLRWQLHCSMPVCTSRSVTFALAFSHSCATQHEVYRAAVKSTRGLDIGGGGGGGGSCSGSGGGGGGGGSGGGGVTVVTSRPTDGGGGGAMPLPVLPSVKLPWLLRLWLVVMLVCQSVLLYSTMARVHRIEETGKCGYY